MLKYDKNIDELTTDELLEQIEADKKQVKKSSIFVIAALVAIIALCIAWFASNNRVTAGMSGISAKEPPFSLATKKANEGSEDSLIADFVGKGTELQLGEDKYYISNGGAIRLQVSPDNNMNNDNDSNAHGIAPGDAGKITFYVIPREKGYKEFTFQMDIKTYKTSEAGIEDLNNPTIQNLLNGHVLFFENYNETDGYTSWIKDGKITIKNDEGFTPNQPVPITVYWVWPEYFQNFMNTGELFKSQNVLDEFVTDMNNDTKNTSEKKYFYGFENDKFNYEGEWTFGTLNASQFTYLTECYNAADFQIGTDIDYFYIEFNCE